MAVRKSGKSALDYDPLSWLKEETADASDTSTGEESAPSDDVEPTEQQQVKADSAPAAPGEPSSEAADMAAEKAADIVETAVEPPEIKSDIAANAVDEPAVQAQSSISDEPTDYVQLDPELTMKNVAEFKQQLDQLMHKDTPIAIDADELRKIDSSGLQLLYSLQKSLAKNGATITIKNNSEVIEAAAKIVGMELEFTVGQRSKEEIEAEQGFGFF